MFIHIKKMAERTPEQIAADQAASCPEKSIDEPMMRPFPDFGAIAEKMGMNQKCIQKANNISHDMNTSTQAVVVTPMGGGGANVNTNESYLDTSMQSEGCGAMSMTAKTIQEEERQMTCNMSKNLSTQETTVNKGASVELKVHTPPPEVISAISLVIQDFNAKDAALQERLINLMSSGGLAAPEGATSETIAALAKIQGLILQSVNNSIAANDRAKQLYMENNPQAGLIKDSEINQTINNKIDLKQSQNIEQSTKIAMQASTKRLAQATAIDTVQTRKGAMAMTESEKNTVIQNVNRKMESENKNVDETVSGNRMNVESADKITLTVYGSIQGTTINQNSQSETALVVDQVIKKALEIGMTVANEYITDETMIREEETFLAGMDDIIAKDGDADAQRLALTQGSLGDTVTAVTDGAAQMIDSTFDGASNVIDSAGNAASSMMMAAMLPLIIIGVLVIGGLFLVPKMAPKLASMTGASPGMIKIGGMLLFAVIVGLIAFFWVMPIFKKKKEAPKEERYRYSYSNTPAPRQGMPNVNKQSLNPYGKEPRKRSEPRYFKGDRNARQIPSYNKIDQNKNFKKPVEGKHSNAYNPINDTKAITTTHNPTYHFQNKVDDKPVMYTKSPRK
tara:strand:+ start:2787 stop:4658 length:1872 start_codon:yes stop_codon:yes gene_type:complete